MFKNLKKKMKLKLKKQLKKGFKVKPKDNPISTLTENYKNLENILSLKEYTLFALALSWLIAGVSEMTLGTIGMLRNDPNPNILDTTFIHYIAYMFLLPLRFIMAGIYYKTSKHLQFDKRSFTYYSIISTIAIALVQVLFIKLGGLTIVALLITMGLLIYHVKTLRTIPQGVR